MTGISVLTALLNGPFIGATRPGAPIVHACEGAEIADSIVSGRYTVDARCGVRVKLIDPGNGVGALWPPRVKSMPEGIRRCPACVVTSERPRDGRTITVFAIGGEGL